MDNFDFGDEGDIFAGQNDLPTRTNQQKMDSYNQEWDVLMPRLVKAYINRFNNSNNTPQYNQYKETCINPRQQLCDCDEPNISFLHIDCIYITGTVFNFFKIY